MRFERKDDRFRWFGRSTGGGLNTERRRRLAGWMAGVIFLSGSGTASGTDWWLSVDPSTVGAKPGERSLHLWEGEGFKPGMEHPLEKERINRFDLYADRARRRDLLATGQDGQMPAAKLPPEPGAGLVVMERKEGLTTPDADAFNRMLAEEGQEATLAQRARTGQSGVEARVADFWYLKALVPGQDPSSTLPNTFYKRRVEQRLEILLQNNPGRLAANHRLSVKVLFEGKPLAGAKVFAFRHDGGGAGAVTGSPAGSAAGTVNGPGAAGLTAVTSPQGLVEFKIDQNGTWLVKTAHLHTTTEPSRKAGPNGGWDHHAASYTFVTKDAPPSTGIGPARVGGGTGGSGGGEGK